MKCSIRSCPGEYEDKRIVQTERREGRIVVIDGVPAAVCSVCGDTLLRIDTVRRIEAILHEGPEPARTAPVYAYAS